MFVGKYLPLHFIITDIRHLAVFFTCPTKPVINVALKVSIVIGRVLRTHSYIISIFTTTHPQSKTNRGVAAGPTLVFSFMTIVFVQRLSSPVSQGGRSIQ